MGVGFDMRRRLLRPFFIIVLSDAAEKVEKILSYLYIDYSRLTSDKPDMAADTIHTAPNAPAFSHFPNASKQAQTLGGGILAGYGAYPFLYGQKSQGPPPTMSCGGNGGPLYNQANGWYCPMDERRHCPLETKPHDRARCDMFNGRWVVDTVDGQVLPFVRTQIQMQPCGVDGQWPPLVGTLGPKTCDPKTGRFYHQGVNALPFNAGYDTTSVASDAGYHKGTGGASSKIGRGGLTTSTPFDYKSTRMDNGIALDRAYTGYAGKGVPFVTAQGLLSPSQTGMSEQNHRARGYQQVNSSVLPLLRHPAYPDPSAYVGRQFGTSRISRDNNLRNTSSITPEDVNAATQMYLRPYENSENDAIIHRGKHQ